MKTKYFWFVITIEENGKYYPFSVRADESTNIATWYEKYGKVKTINICNTKKRAAELVQIWRAAFYANGTYLFDDPRF